MTAQNINKLNKGFTLIELLVVIGILAILLAITLIAINPARQFQQSNDTKRRSDVSAILNSIGQYAADNKGALPGDGTGAGGTNLITTTPTVIASTTVANICSFLVTQYIAALPGDPTTGTGTPVSSCAGAYNTGYSVSKSASDNRVTVSAVGQITSSISATR